MFNILVGNPQVAMAENSDPIAGSPGSPEPGREITSDYDPSQEGSMFGSLSSSIKDHVWEFGRYPILTLCFVALC